MPSTLPGQITLPTREERKARWKTSYLSRATDGDLDDPQLEADASVNADATAPLYANQRIYASNAVLEDATGIGEDGALFQWGKREGVGPPLTADGSIGFVIISASVGGTPIDNGQVLVDPDTSLQYQAVIDPALSPQTFTDGQYCPVQAIDTGTKTNVFGGKSLTWSSASSGSGPTAIVATNADGSGLTGGREDETEPEYRLRIRQEKADRSKHANDADYRTTVTNTPGLRVQQVFTCPAILGTGSTAAFATLSPSKPGGSRVPTEAQRGLVEAYVVEAMPGDDCSFFPVLTEQNVDIVYKVAWATGAAGWADVNPWPLYYPVAGTPGPVVVASAASGTSFTLSATSYVGVRQPVAGQTICFYSQADGAFQKKRILSFTGAGPWAITVDTTNNSSDVAYIPIVGQRAMPWSKSLPALLPTLWDYFDKLGPGEMTATFYDVGRRMRRVPLAPKEWPNVLTTKGLEDAIDVDQVHDRVAIEGPGQTTTVGTPGTIVYQMRLRWVSLFPL